MKTAIAIILVAIMVIIAFYPIIYDYIYFKWIIHRRVARKVDEYFSTFHHEGWEEYKKSLKKK